MRRWLARIVIATAWTAVATSVYAQNAQLSGVVKDSSGAVIPGVTITARNVETGLTRVAFTEATGEYRVPSLPPGRYSVTTE